MLSRYLLVAVLAPVLLGLNGCTHYREVPPQSAEGQACVKQCYQRKMRCQDKEDESYEGFKGLYDSQYRSYQNCLHVTSDPTLKALCHEPTAPSGPEYRYCSSSYKDCFVECGGSYEKVE